MPLYDYCIVAGEGFEPTRLSLGLMRPTRYRTSDNPQYLFLYDYVESNHDTEVRTVVSYPLNDNRILQANQESNPNFRGRNSVSYPLDYMPVYSMTESNNLLPGM